MVSAMGASARRRTQTRKPQIGDETISTHRTSSWSISNYKDMYFITIFTVCGFLYYKINERWDEFKSYFTSESYVKMSIFQCLLYTSPP